VEKVKIKLFLLFFCLGTGVLWAQVRDEAQILLDEISLAVDADFYDKALDLMDRGISEFPGDSRFHQAKGDLYRSRELYSMALDSYRSAENFNSQDKELRRSIATVLGYLDLNFESLKYLENLISEGEDSLLDDLGWMYYKTHQPEKGIQMIRDALDREFDRNLSLTLGTLYSELNDSVLCREYYLMAIEDALANGDSYFASVGYYNLSLAEKSFYDYEAAADYAALSLEYMDRAGGHLALSDLLMQKENFKGAESEILKAVDLDETPLARSNLVTLYLETGQLNRALQELHRIEENQDESWMYYYGLNRDQFSLELYDQYYRVYLGLSRRTRLFHEWGAAALWNRLRDRLSYSLKAVYYKILYRSLSLREGRSQIEGGSLLRGYLTLASASEGFPSFSGRYFEKAWKLEGFSQADPWYDLVLGREYRDRERLEKASDLFDPVWEIQPRDETLREIALMTRPGKRDEYDPVILDLFSRNPGGLVQYGLRLPLYVQFSGSENSGLERRLKRYLRGSGFILRNDPGTSLILRIRISGSFQYVLSTREGQVRLSGTDEEIPATRNSLAEWVRSFRQSVFIP